MCIRDSANVGDGSKKIAHRTEDRVAVGGKGQQEQYRRQQDHCIAETQRDLRRRTPVSYTHLGFAVFRSLHMKLVLIMLLLITSLMAVVGAFLMTSVKMCIRDSPKLM